MKFLQVIRFIFLHKHKKNEKKLLLLHFNKLHHL